MTDAEEQETTVSAEELFRRQVMHEVRTLRVRETARRQLRKEQAGAAGSAGPALTILPDLLSEPDAPTPERIEGLLSVGDRVILSAPFKSGKTIFVANVVRSLVDGVPFLGQFRVTPVDGRVVVLDTEMSREKLKEWMRDQRVNRADRVAVETLRGNLTKFDVLDASVRQEWADALNALDARVLIVDCLRPLLDAFGIDEHKNAGLVLTALDELVGLTGITELIVVHHMGHNGERSRGDSRLRDWPDSEWQLVRQDADDPSSVRFFRAYGRDVEIPETALEYEPTTRRLTFGGGNRSDAAAEKLVPTVVQIVHSEPGATGRGIERTLAEREVGQKNGRQAIKRAITEAYLRAVPGPGRSIQHFVTAKGERLLGSGEPVSAGDAPAGKDHVRNDLVRSADAPVSPGHSSGASVRQRASAFPQRSDSECVSASIGDAHAHTRTNGASASDSEALDLIRARLESSPS